MPPTLSAHSPTYIDWTQVQRQVAGIQNRYPHFDESRSFLYFALRSVLDLDEDAILEAITDGPRDKGIDAIAIVPTSAGPCVHIFQTKHRQSFEASHRDFPPTEVEKILNFLNEFLNRRSSLLKNCNDALKEKIRQLYLLLDQSTPQFVVNLCSNGRPLSSADCSRFKQELDALRTFRLAEFHLSDFGSLSVTRGTSKPNGKLVLIGKASQEQSDGEIRGFIGTTTVENLAHLIRDPTRTDRANPAAFSDNFRPFLGFQQEFNELIFKSAVDRKNHRFWYLNNGITIICEKYSYQPSLMNPPIELSGFQIINGCQSSHVLLEAFTKYPDRVRSVNVLVRVYETSDSLLSKQVAEATNTQTRIKPRDLKANDFIQRKIEKILLSHGFFYERKENQYAEKDPSRRIDALRFGQIAVSWEREEPERAKAQSDRIFGPDYEIVFEPNIDVEKALAVFQLFQRLEKRAADAVSDSEESPKKAFLRFFAYARFHYLYAYKLVLEKKKQELPLSEEDFNSYFLEITDILVEIITEQPRRSFYELFRAPDTKRLIAGKIYPNGLLDGLFRPTKTGLVVQRP